MPEALANLLDLETAWKRLRDDVEDRSYINIKNYQKYLLIEWFLENSANPSEALISIARNIAFDPKCQR
jgi:hypothetical protein